MIPPATMARLATLGLSADQAAAVAEMMSEVEAATEAKISSADVAREEARLARVRDGNRERKARERGRHAVSRVTLRDPSPPPSLSPKPPNPPTPSPVDITPPPSEAAPRGADRSRGARIASDWTLDAEGRAYAADIGLAGSEIDREAVNFHDFWLAKAGAAGRKVDWPATWRTWARRAAEIRGRAPSGRSARPPPSNARLDVAGELLDYLHERDYPG